MTRFLVGLLLVIGFGGEAFSAQKPKKIRRPASQPATPATTPAAKTAPITRPMTAPRAAIKKENDENDTRFYTHKLNTFLGINISRTSALALGAQFGHVIDHATPFYVGPEVNFSLFSPGNVIEALASAWYEMRVYGSPRLSLHVGAALGGAFTSGLANVSGVTYAAFLEGAIAQDVDDLVTVRGQFRPGVIGQYFAFMMNLSVQFRFL